LRRMASLPESDVALILGTRPDPGKPKTGEGPAFRAGPSGRVGQDQ
jgi:hypothetical protein